MGEQAKQHALERKLDLRDQAKGWREVADSLYARAVYSQIVQPMEDEGLAYIASEMNLMRVPKVRGSGVWTTSDVSRLLCRVAAMADETTNPKAWKHKMDALTASSCEGVDSECNK